ncbi:LOW QUALITY PROTEIN: sulfotransferase 1B1-like [Patella vulgata]|uniref:LOW QUALITY PROTEIN: sulfotransferase 1B1-like n=1 Tax=Patella vulgata TaxID=6465 RepID=UPI0024A964CB|nr:LOW QUALITY PROTEIN: sulfotransferase 1B1-like [Patella vulgata]
MSVVNIPDAAGKILTVQEIDGRLYPRFDPGVLRNVPSLKLRDDDVILCGFPKSGTHWLFEIGRSLLHGKLGTDVKPKESLFVDMVPESELNKVDSPRILNTHVRFDRLPSDVKTKNLKILYVRRNPKDLVVSYYNHTHGEFKDYLPLFSNGLAYGSWFEYVLEWEKIIANNQELSILDVAYENLKEDPIQEIRRLSDFLGVQRNKDFIEEISDFCNFSTMKGRFKDKMGIKDGHNIFYRKGEVGDWKNWFTVAQNEWFDQLYREKMADSKLKFKFTLNED